MICRITNYGLFGTMRKYSHKFCPHENYAGEAAYAPLQILPRPTLDENRPAAPVLVANDLSTFFCKLRTVHYSIVLPSGKTSVRERIFRDPTAKLCRNCLYGIVTQEQKRKLR